MVAGITTLYGRYGEQFNSYSDERWPLGTRMAFSDGRIFRFAENASVAMVAGSLYASGAPNANTDELAVQAAAAIGDVSVSITNGTLAFAADVLKGGYMNVENDAGEGRLYTIGAHAALAASATIVVPLIDGESIQVALTTSSTVGLWQNSFKNVVIAPATIVTGTVGLACAAVAADEFGWLQTWGPCSILTDGVLVVGQHGRSSDGVAGAIEPLNRDVAAEDEQSVCVVLEISATTEHSFCYLTLAP